MNALWLSLCSKADLARRTVDLGRPTVVLDLVSHLVRKPFKLRRAGFESVISSGFLFNLEFSTMMNLLCLCSRAKRTSYMRSLKILALLCPTRKNR